ncbi:MAG: T9SS type A sorting domain-containing protein [Bacteroidia bacterium]|nr:T9SS type A sorting domain-containing protein [Bacteroidia bacterium]
MKAGILIFLTSATLVLTGKAQLVNQTTLTIQSGVNLYVEGNGQNQNGATIQNAGTLHLKANFSNSGTSLVAGKVIADGTSGSQTLTGNSNFHTLEIDNSNGVSVNSGATVGIVPTNAVGSLNLKSGTFTAPAGAVTLQSNSNGTAYLDNFSSGMNGVYNPSSLLTVQRYVPGSTTYHYLSTPVSGTFISDWSDDFTIQGQDGFVNDGVTNTIPWPTLWRYEESNPNANMMVGWIATTGASNPIDRVRGYACMFSGTTVDVLGTVSQTTPTRPITHTTSTQPLSDGWNLVGNPHPSMLDWDLVYSQNSSLVSAIIYQWKVNQYVSYNALTGVSINGGSDKIASSQGFFIRCNSSGSFSIPGSTRITGTNAPFFKQEQPEWPFLRLGIGRNQALSHEDGDWDETVVYQDLHSSDELDEYGDAPKFLSEQSPAISIYTLEEETPLTMNALKHFQTEKTIPIGVKVTASGAYNFLPTELLNTGGMKIIWEDRLQKNSVVLEPGKPIQVLIGKDEAETGRFFLRLSNAENPENNSTQPDLLMFLSQNQLHLIRSQGLEPATIDLVNLSGQVVTSYRVGSEPDYTISCENLSQGIYLARYQQGEKVVIRKVVLE